MDNTWAHNNPLFATTKRRLQQSIIIHPIQASHTASPERWVHDSPVPSITFPNSPLLWNFRAIPRVHGAFYTDTTPIHVPPMARAHKVCNHPRNTSKEKLY
jgi:hypothetical protein